MGSPTKTHARTRSFPFLFCCPATTNDPIVVFLSFYSGPTTLLLQQGALLGSLGRTLRLQNCDQRLELLIIDSADRVLLENH